MLTAACKPGISWKDDCNKCVCTAERKPKCTEMLCFPTDLPLVRDRRNVDGGIKTVTSKNDENPTCHQPKHKLGWGISVARQRKMSRAIKIIHFRRLHTRIFVERRLQQLSLHQGWGSCMHLEGLSSPN